MEIVSKKIERNIVTVKDLAPGVPFKVATDDEYVYIKASINTGDFDALCLNNGQLYREFVADVVEVKGAFVEEAHTIHATNDYSKKQVKYIKSICAELEAVKESKQLYMEQAQAKTDEIIRLNNAIKSLHNDVRDLEDELTATKNLIERIREMQRQTAEDNDNLRDSLTQKDKIIDSLRSELKDLRAALNFKSDDEELTVVAARKAVERIKQLERDNEALMFQLQKERESVDTANNAVIEQQSVQLQEADMLLEQIANIVYGNEFHCSGQAILNNPERLLTKLKKLMETTDTTKSEYTLSDSKIDEMQKKLFTAGLNLDFKDRNDAAIAEELADKLIEVQQSYTDYIGEHSTNKKDTDNQRLTTATKERILTDIANEGITFKPVNDSVDALVSELTYAYIADHVTCRKILEQCRAFSDAVLKHEEHVLDYSGTDEENDDFEEPTA